MSELECIGLNIEKAPIGRFDKIVAKNGTKNRSEAIRDLVRDRIIEQEWEDDRGEAVATVTLVYDHKKRQLADRLMEAGHEHHGMVMATMHLHLDEDACLEVIALRGRIETEASMRLRVTVPPVEASHVACRR